MKRWFIFFLLAGEVLFNLTTNAQNSYFQQFVKYNIDVKLNDINHTLSAFESLEYTNNSPTPLTKIYIHLWPNAYKNHQTAMAKQLLENGETKFYDSKASDRGYIDSLDFKINGQPANWNLIKDSIDIAILNLTEPLLPGNTITITTPFKVKIPSALFSRLGHLDQSYQITQWYPKPAVYDQYGWHPIPYLTQGEFYSEFGTYDVKITLPKNYVLGATGDMVDGDSELEWLNNLDKKTRSNTNFDSKNMDFPASSPEYKTLHFHQEKVHDFAFFADKRFHVLKSEVQLPHSKRKVTTWAMFTNENAEIWKKADQYINDAVYYYSLWNGDYPYNHCTAVDGTISAGGGMEYPNITVIGSTSDAFMLDVVIAHEVGHNWFYGILGSNERENAWMDEGLNSFNEMRYVQTKYPDRKLGGKSGSSVLGKWFDFGQYPHWTQYYLGSHLSARYNIDQPLCTHSADYISINYGTVVYMKTATIFNYLRSYLGEETFDKCMQTYFETWKFKHPYPADIKKTLEETSGKNLDWLFKDLINTINPLDYKIVKAGYNQNGNLIKIKNNGKVNGPVQIAGFIDGKKRAEIWYDGFKGTQWLAFPPGNFDNYVINSDNTIPEYNYKNNTYNLNKLFKKTEPFRLQFLGALDNKHRTQLFYTPVAGYNYNNKFMIGAAFYNHSVFPKKLEWTLIPMFATGTKTATGYADLYWNIKKIGLFKNIKIGGEYKTYSYLNQEDIKPFTYNFNFSRIVPTLQFDLNKRRERSKFSQVIKTRYLIIQEDYIKDATKLADGSWQTVLGKWNTNIAEFTYSATCNRKINPFSYELQHSQNDRFARTQFTFNYSFTYKKKNRSFDIRAFAGKMWYHSPYNFKYLTPNSQNVGLNMNGDLDYAYNSIVLDRFKRSNALSNQALINDGGFKNITNQTLAYNWLAALNMQASLPLLPLKAYLDLGWSNLTNSALINSGIAFVIAPKIAEVYFPVYQNYSLTGLKYGEKIRFVLNFNLMNPFSLTQKLTSIM